MRLLPLAARVVTVCNDEFVVPAAVASTALNLARMRVAASLPVLVPAVRRAVPTMYASHVAAFVESHSLVPWLDTDTLSDLRRRAAAVRGIAALDELLAFAVHFTQAGFDAKPFLDELDLRLEPVLASRAALTDSAVHAILAALARPALPMATRHRLVAACWAAVDTPMPVATLPPELDGLDTFSDTVSLHYWLGGEEEPRSVSRDAENPCERPETLSLLDAFERQDTSRRLQALLHVEERVHVTPFLVVVVIARWHQQRPLTQDEAAVLLRLLAQRVEKGPSPDTHAAVESYAWGVALRALQSKP